jgi:hypothetical protein
VHATAVNAVQGLRHEGGVHAVVRCDLLGDQAGDHHVVGHLEGFIVVRVDLVLRGSYLVV